MVDGGCIGKKEKRGEKLEKFPSFFTEFVLNGEFMVLVIVYYITHTNIIEYLYI